MTTSKSKLFQKQFILVSLSAILLLIADLVSKNFAFENFQEPYSLIGKFFQLHYQENFGIAFSIPLPYWFIIAINFILLVAIIYLADKELNLGKAPARFGITLLIAGALGNLTDRICSGYVIDFIEIWKWPAFNLADTYIVIGVLLLLAFYAKLQKN